MDASVIDHRWVTIVVIILGIAIAVMAGFSISAFWAARQGKPISPATANGLWIGNIILLIIAIGIILWAFFTLFFYRPRPALAAALAVPTVESVNAPLQPAVLEEYLNRADLNSASPTSFTVAQELTSTGGSSNRVSASGLQRYQSAIGNYSY
jgi:glycerol-3-phosphate acyltransferase PlsY